MAAVADYGGGDYEKGVYGLYNDFLVRITQTGDDIKLKFRMRITVIGSSPLV